MAEKIIEYQELDRFARILKNKGKFLCLVYSGEFNDATKKVYSQISRHLVGITSMSELESTDKTNCVYYSLESLRVAGYEIGKLKVVYPEYFMHTRITENGVFHVLKGGGKMNEHLLCGKYWEELVDTQEYNNGMEAVHKVCKVCEERYKIREYKLF
jgi:hypothetical protein